MPNGGAGTNFYCFKTMDVSLSSVTHVTEVGEYVCIVCKMALL